MVNVTAKETNIMFNNDVQSKYDQSCPVQIPDYVQKKTGVTRSFHPKRFINLGSKSNTYKYSFFIKTVKEWNGLSDELIEQETIESFKSALADYFNH